MYQNDPMKVLTGEVRLLEGLIQQMSESIDERLRIVPMAAPDSVESRHRQQSNLLLQTVHDALVPGHALDDLDDQPPRVDRERTVGDEE